MALPTYTTNFNVPIPRPGQRGFQDEYAAGFQTFDSVLALYISVNNFVGRWENSTAYTATETVVDVEGGGVWRCDQSHTSPAAPTTFAAYRTANPSVWSNATLEVRNRGVWASATNYRVGDFVATAASNGKIAFCLVTHTSSGTFEADLASGYWSVLIDLTDYTTSEFLASIAALNPFPADSFVYASVEDVAASSSITAFGRTWLALADAAAGLTTLGAAATSHTHAASAITSGTIDAARLGSGTPSSANFLRGDSAWAVPVTTQVQETITGNDTIVAADLGTCFRVTANCTIAFEAAATLGAGFWCDIMVDGDYNDLRHITLNPNGAEEIDLQATIKAYPLEKFRVFCTGALLRTYGRASEVFFGEETIPTGAQTATFFTDGAFFDDPEMVEFTIHVSGYSQNNASGTFHLRITDGSGVAITANYSFGSFSDYTTPTGDDGTSASQANLTTSTINAAATVEARIQLWVMRGLDAATFGTFQSHTSTNAPIVGWFRNTAELGGFQFRASPGNIDAGTVRYWGKRLQRS